MATPPTDLDRVFAAWANLQRLINVDAPALIARIVKAWSSLPF